MKPKYKVVFKTKWLRTWIFHHSTPKNSNTPTPAAWWMMWPQTVVTAIALYPLALLYENPHIRTGLKKNYSLFYHLVLPCSRQLLVCRLQQQWLNIQQHMIHSTCTLEIMPLGLVRQVFLTRKIYLIWNRLINHAGPRYSLRFLCVSLITTRKIYGRNPDGSLTLANSYRAVCPGYPRWYFTSRESTNITQTIPEWVLRFLFIGWNSD